MKIRENNPGKRHCNNSNILTFAPEYLGWQVRACNLKRISQRPLRACKGQHDKRYCSAGSRAALPDIDGNRAGNDGGNEERQDIRRVLKLHWTISCADLIWNRA